MERRATHRSEYFDGEMFAMAGASRQHNRILTNLVTGIDTHLKSRSCNVYANDMRIYVPSTGYFTYPDIVITCGKEEFSDAYNDILVNPLAIVEILSDSTASYDRGKKFEHYRELTSFVEYLLVDQHTPRIEQYVRQTSAQWLYTDIRGIENQTVTIQAIECSLSMYDIYHKVDWPQQPIQLRSAT
jgi:Uma2 family endonuclease